MTTTDFAPTILRLDASMRREGSVSRRLLDRLVTKLTGENGAVRIVRRDLAEGAPGLVSEAWIDANFTPADERTAEQQAVLAESDMLVEELKSADILAVGVPIYNFGVPAALKAWVDMVARARLTFNYTENGPVGLLEGKKAYLVVASGGTESGSAIDFATGYMKHVLGFIGIHDVEVITADRLMADAGREDRAVEAIEALQELPAAA